MPSRFEDGAARRNTCMSTPLPFPLLSSHVPMSINIIAAELSFVSFVLGNEDVCRCDAEPPPGDNEPVSHRQDGSKACDGANAPACGHST